MNITLIASLVGGALLILIIAAVLHRRIPRKLKVAKYIGDWKQLQQYCRDKTTWPQAIIDADKLLDKALKRRKYKGKSMGERMVSAQRKVTNNDQLWFAHNLAKKIKADPTIKLKETDVKGALVGFRQALKDIGALKTPEQEPPEEAAEAKNG